MNDSAAASLPAQNARSSSASRRRRWLSIFAVLVLLVAAGFVVWRLGFASYSIETDNAYTAVEVAQITPLVSGAVTKIGVVDSQTVRTGDVLVVLDDTDSRIALTQAEANLARTKRQIRQIIANDAHLAGQVDLRGAERLAAEADVKRARAVLDKAILDARRRRDLIEDGAISQQDLTDVETRLSEAEAGLEQAEARVSVAKAAVLAAGGAREANAALIGDSTVEDHPDVRAAAARLEQARVDKSRTLIRAPVGGVVVQRAVDVGQHVQAGMRLMSIVPVAEIHVDANFKESQLRDVRPGQMAQLTSDLYGGGVVYDGMIEGIAAGSGSAFAAIPAQNATGNWIKVVQRLPVRIRLNPEQLAEHPLRVGLSMKVTVDLDAARAE
jgi:membrane fusion protein (multidrug efflux system)